MVAFGIPAEVWGVAEMGKSTSARKNLGAFG